ncbi:hypothetical protein C8R44DRAFT_727782 [Mycena epipterygia]|nr:hypothetical protein C8R44DRAFT_727782 [Mycena epipterygia]
MTPCKTRDILIIARQFGLGLWLRAAPQIRGWGGKFEYNSLGREAAGRGCGLRKVCWASIQRRDDCGESNHDIVPQIQVQSADVSISLVGSRWVAPIRDCGRAATVGPKSGDAAGIVPQIQVALQSAGNLLVGRRPLVNGLILHTTRSGAADDPGRAANSSYSLSWTGINLTAASGVVDLLVWSLGLGGGCTSFGGIQVILGLGLVAPRGIAVTSLSFPTRTAVEDRRSGLVPGVELYPPLEDAYGDGNEGNPREPLAIGTSTCWWGPASSLPPVRYVHDLSMIHGHNRAELPGKIHDGKLRKGPTDVVISVLRLSPPALLIEFPITQNPSRVGSGWVL